MLDGLVYAGMVGIGFAFTENLLYLAASFDGGIDVGPGGAVALSTTFVVRCLISPFAHPFFTAFIGIGVGLAIASRRTWVRLVAPAGRAGDGDRRSTPRGTTRRSPAPRASSWSTA